MENRLLTTNVSVHADEQMLSVTGAGLSLRAPPRTSIAVTIW
jgi:hypothetical protein